MLISKLSTDIPTKVNIMYSYCYFITPVSVSFSSMKRKGTMAPIPFPTNIDEATKGKYLMIFWGENQFLKNNM